MSILILFIVHSILLWVLFIAVEVKHIGGKPLMFVGAIVDFTYNVIWGSLMFFQIPREVFFSQRVSKNKYLDGYRGKLARFICTHLLNRFLPNHCKDNNG